MLFELIAFAPRRKNMADAGGDGEVSISAGIDATRGMFLSKILPHPTWSDQAPGGISLVDLPLQDTLSGDAQVKHVVDVIRDVPPPSKSTIESAINNGDWGSNILPSPFCMKTDMELKLIMQFCCASPGEWQGLRTEAHVRPGC